MKNIITPATLMNPYALEYRVPGKVLRVFDSNGHGELMPVGYTPHADEKKFTLQNAAHGKVHAEYERPY
jgi:hypothetical protein